MRTRLHNAYIIYGLATISRLLQITGLFCRISSLLLVSFAKETYNLKEPTNRSHHIYISCVHQTHKYVRVDLHTQSSYIDTYTAISVHVGVMHISHIHIMRTSNTHINIYTHIHFCTHTYTRSNAHASTHQSSGCPGAHTALIPNTQN